MLFYYTNVNNFCTQQGETERVTGGIYIEQQNASSICLWTRWTSSVCRVISYCLSSEF